MNKKNSGKKQIVVRDSGGVMILAMVLPMIAYAYKNRRRDRP